MATLKCPACGAKGEVRATEESFEVRGRTSDDWGWPIRKCRACGNGLIVKPRTFPPGVKAEVIPVGTWQAMEEESWEAEFGDK